MTDPNTHNRTLPDRVDCDGDHDWQRHPNTNARRCTHCHATPADVIDDRLDEAEDAALQGSAGGAVLALVRAVRLMWESR